MAFFSLLVLAITYSQGAARPAEDNFGYITTNDVASSEGFQMNSDDGNFFRIPTNIRNGDIITINGTLKLKDNSFTMVFSSLNAEENCQIKYYFENQTMAITPPVKGYNTTTYNLSLSSESAEAPPFSLQLTPRVNNRGQEMFSMIFYGNNAGNSAQLICQIGNFEDIKHIVIKEGVEHIDSLSFEFGENH